MVVIKSFCDSPLWDSNQTWNTNDPSVTTCMRESVLSFLPLVIFVLMTPFDFRFLYTKNAKIIPWRLKNTAYFLLTFVLTFATVVEAVVISMRLYEETITVWSPFVEVIVYFFTFFISFLIANLYRIKGRCISWSHTGLWFVSIIVFIVRLISQFHVKSDLILKSFTTIYIFSTMLLLILSSFVDYSLEFTEVDENGEAYRCPLQESSLLSRLTFFWMFKYIILGIKTRIEPVHFDELCSESKSEQTTKQFDKLYRKYNSNIGLNSKKFKLFSVLWGTVKSPLCGAMLLEFFSIVFSFLSPLLLSQMITFLVTEEALWHGAIFAVGYSLCSLFGQMCESHHQYLLHLSAVRTKSSLIAVVYRKIFKLSSASRKAYTTGDISNLMYVDTEEVFQVILWLPQLFGLPLRIAIGLYFLYTLLGSSAFSVFGVFLVLFPASAIVSKKMDALQVKQMELKDRRISQITEMLNGIKVLKLYAWEHLFLNRITETRAAELRNLLFTCVLSSVFAILWTMTPTILACVSFSVYILTDVNHTMDAKTLFVSLSLFSSLRYPFALLPEVVTRFIGAKVSYLRLKNYFLAEELDADCIGHEMSSDENCISVNNATFTWELENGFVLQDLDFRVKTGSLVAVVGAVGSGKSSLFAALIGNLYKRNGFVNVVGKQAYVAQQAWIQNATLLKNILFVKGYDEIFYKKVLEACALQVDIAMLPSGDRTMIGEKGINLSGGQKQRVSLARAVYQDADVYFLDDPLSAVDATVANHLFEEVIGPKGLLRNKTRLIATHNLSVLPEVDNIIVLKDGKIIAEGNYDELSSAGILSSNLVNENQKEAVEESLDSVESTVLTSEKGQTRKDSKRKSESSADELMDEETYEVGDISLSVYFHYLRKAGILVSIFSFIILTGIGVFDIGATYWLILWTNQNSTVLRDFNDRRYRLNVYYLILSAEGLCVVFGTILALYGGVQVSKLLHKEMLLSVLRSPLSFFDVTPTGRIVNRFSKDMTSIDFEVPFCFIEFNNTATSLMIIFAIIMTTSAYFLIGLVVFAVLYYIIYKLYIRTSRQLKHHESISSSPVYNHFNESISGAMTVKAFGVERQFLEMSNANVDENSKCYLYQSFSSLWLEIWMQFLAVVIIFATSMTILLNRDTFSTGFSGLVLTYSTEVVLCSGWLVRMAADLETHLVATERVIEYSKLTPEAEWRSEENKPSCEWPQEGRIEFENYSTSYRQGMSSALKDISLKIEKGEKIGIVGRTGAGKSSLTLALFRILEPTNGTINIDGVDVTRIGLHDLRTKISIIPQDPVLFSVALRRNLDPWETHSDEELWNALDDSHLKDYVSSLNEGLDYEVAEGGENLSAGQRQLLCLARALLRNSKILVLDEATAAVDTETDTLIQKTIREKFKLCTVLTIAHRLNTVIDNDRIILLSNGRIIETGTPSELLGNPESNFYAMAKESGIVS